MEGFEAYRTWVAVSQHFNPKTNYDYGYFNGRVKVTHDSYKKRPDKWVFAYIERDYKEDLPLFFATANQVVGFGSTKNLLSSKARRAFEIRKRELDKFPEKFFNELVLALTWYKDNVGQLLESPIPGAHPRIFQHLIAGDISEETYIVLDRLTGFVKFCSAKVNDPILWGAKHEELNKKGTFLYVDIEKCKIMLDRARSSVIK